MESPKTPKEILDYIVSMPTITGVPFTYPVEMIFDHKIFELREVDIDYALRMCPPDFLSLVKTDVRERLIEHKIPEEKHDKYIQEYSKPMPYPVISEYGVILDGLHRLCALKKLGKKTAMVYYGILEDRFK